MTVKDGDHESAGTIAALAAYDAHRLTMATAVWRKMNASDSRECRNCHAFEYMDPSLQKTRAAGEHKRALDHGLSCIDCHQGVAHSLPARHLEQYRKIADDFMAGHPASLRAGGEPIAQLRGFLPMKDTE